MECHIAWLLRGCAGRDGNGECRIPLRARSRPTRWAISPGCYCANRKVVSFPTKAVNTPSPSTRTSYNSTMAEGGIPRINDKHRPGYVPAWTKANLHGWQRLQEVLPTGSRSSGEPAPPSVVQLEPAAASAVLASPADVPAAAKVFSSSSLLRLVSVVPISWLLPPFQVAHLRMQVPTYCSIPKYIVNR